MAGPFDVIFINKAMMSKIGDNITNSTMEINISKKRVPSITKSNLMVNFIWEKGGKYYDAYATNY